MSKAKKTRKAKSYQDVIPLWDVTYTANDKSRTALLACDGPIDAAARTAAKRWNWATVTAIVRRDEHATIALEIHPWQFT